MTKSEISKEVQAQVEFKMNEFLTVVKNRLAFKHQQAFDMTQKSQYVWQAFEEVSEILKKEMCLPTPYDNMSQQKKWEAKEKAVKEISKTLDPHDRRYDNKIKAIVSAIEAAQNW